MRLGRAMLRSGVRLVILDEPFRGLDREQRRELLTRARRMWRHATLLCITHDVSETQAFARVLVVEGGRLLRMVPQPTSPNDQGRAIGPCWQRKQRCGRNSGRAPPGGDSNSRRAVAGA